MRQLRDLRSAFFSDDDLHSPLSSFAKCKCWVLWCTSLVFQQYRILSSQMIFETQKGSPHSMQMPVGLTSEGLQSLFLTYHCSSKVSEISFLVFFQWINFAMAWNIISSYKFSMKKSDLRLVEKYRIWWDLFINYTELDARSMICIST